MTRKRFASVWDVIEDTSEEAEDMTLRSSLILALQAHMARGGGLKRPDWQRNVRPFVGAVNSHDC
jgi:predicted XRE-type DNA-binding protein